MTKVVATSSSSSQESQPETEPATAAVPAPEAPKPPALPAAKPREIGGPKGPEPTRYGDWEVGGRCTDF
jgi:hypothetical protein